MYEVRFKYNGDYGTWQRLSTCVTALEAEKLSGIMKEQFKLYCFEVVPLPGASESVAA